MNLKKKHKFQFILIQIARKVKLYESYVLVAGCTSEGHDLSLLCFKRTDFINNMKTIDKAPAFKAGSNLEARLIKSGLIMK